MGRKNKKQKKPNCSNSNVDKSKNKAHTERTRQTSSKHTENAARKNNKSVFERDVGDASSVGISKCLQTNQSNKQDKNEQMSCERKTLSEPETEEFVDNKKIRDSYDKTYETETFNRGSKDDVNKNEGMNYETEKLTELDHSKCRKPREQDKNENRSCERKTLAKPEPEEFVDNKKFKGLHDKKNKTKTFNSGSKDDVNKNEGMNYETEKLTERDISKRREPRASSFNRDHKAKTLDNESRRNATSKDESEKSRSSENNWSKNRQEVSNIRHGHKDMLGKQICSGLSKTFKAEYDDFENKYMNNKKMDFKIVNETFGDLFTADKEYSLGHCVAEDMSMGSGIAVMFRQIFKRVDELLSQGKTQGEVAVLQDKQRYIYYLVTKVISTGKPTYYTLWCSLHEMRNHMISYDVKKLAMPCIGCGLDRLEWKWVKNMLEYIFQNDDIEILIYNFQQEPDAAQPKLRKCPVVNVAYPISAIEYGTIIVYFGSEDGYETQELKTIGEKFANIPYQYKREKKEKGKFIFTNKFNEGYAFYGCIVRRVHTDPIDFICFQKCLNLIQTQNRKDKYEYIAFQAFTENRDDKGLTVSKILNLMRYAMTNVQVYVCWPENLSFLMPRSY